MQSSQPDFQEANWVSNWKEITKPIEIVFSSSPTSKHKSISIDKSGGWNWVWYNDWRRICFEFTVQQSNLVVEAWFPRGKLSLKFKSFLSSPTSPGKTISFPFAEAFQFLTQNLTNPTRVGVFTFTGREHFEFSLKSSFDLCSSPTCPVSVRYSILYVPSTFMLFLFFRNGVQVLAFQTTINEAVHCEKTGKCDLKRKVEWNRVSFHKT